MRIGDEVQMLIVAGEIKPVSVETGWLLIAAGYATENSQMFTQGLENLLMRVKQEVNR